MENKNVENAENQIKINALKNVEVSVPKKGKNRSELIHNYFTIFTWLFFDAQIGRKFLVEMFLVQIHLNRLNLFKS